MKNIKAKQYFVVILIMISITYSCQKVINVDLNDAAPQLVIIGTVTDQPGPYTVTLSQTVNFSDDNVFPAVSGAKVIISDNVGNTETLVETSSGNYTSSTIQGVAGRTYSISVTSNGKNYNAISTMPSAVAIDSLTIDSTSSKGGGFGKSKTGNKSVNVLFKDPLGVANYYRFVEIVNGIQKNDFFITSDKFKDGANINYNISIRDSTLYSGDSVTVILQSIDVNVYEYFRTLIQTSTGSGLQTSTPGNPTTNLSNNALGYFSAGSVRSKKILIK
jgi:hypothetical protein